MFIGVALCGLAGGWPAPARAQSAAQGPAPPLRIFIDCYECDTEFLRQNVTFVDYMRDRTDADLHVLVTTQSTGGGGTSWTVKFIGLGRYLSQDRTQTFSTQQTATGDDRRKEFARVFRLGLAGYAADTAVARQLELTWKPPAQQTAAGPARRDAWHLWVFRMNGNGSVNGEQSTKSRRYNASFSGNRVTKDWKISLSHNRNASENRFTLSDGTKLKSSSDSWGVNALAVKSLGPRLSMGGRVNASHSSFSNSNRAVSVYPGIEYDFFPYTDFQRRSLTIWYELGPNFYDYREVTIFNKVKETVIKQQVDVTLALRQPWGSARVFTGVSQDVRHPSRYSVSLNGSTDVRLFKGFSFNIFASYSKIQDQIALPLAGASADEVLLRFISGFDRYLERHGLFLDLTSYRLHGNVKRRDDRTALLDVEVTALLDEFRSDLDWLEQVEGARDCLQRLSPRLDIVVLTNIAPAQASARLRNLESFGLDLPVIANTGLKGEPVRALASRAGRPSFFVDDIPQHLASAAQAAPDVTRIHLIGDERLKPLLPAAEHADFRAESWADAHDFIVAKLSEAGL
jgi:hypothetical protein